MFGSSRKMQNIHVTFLCPTRQICNLLLVSDLELFTSCQLSIKNLNCQLVVRTADLAFTITAVNVTSEVKNCSLGVGTKGQSKSFFTIQCLDLQIWLQCTYASVINQKFRYDTKVRPSVFLVKKSPAKLLH